jgi:DNA-binding CsgD family transcriptional regulator/tetratricopeptide (TPR) repeat protein
MIWGMSPEAVRPRFVARQVELAALRDALKRASAGQSATVLMGGDAGVGKTRLVAELAEGARRDGVLVLVGRCIDVGDGELPYAPIAGALRSLAAQLDAGELDEALGPGRAELARLVPDLGHAPAEATGAFGKARLYELLLGTLGRLGARAPVLLVIEDLHWADGSTRDLLRFLVRGTAAERLAIVATYRTDELTSALRPFLVELGRDPGVGRVTVAPFSRTELAEHVAAILGAVPEAATLERLYERSEGNAFFAEELLAASGGGDLPASLREAMLAHLDRLPEPSRRLVGVIAAAGRRAHHRLVSAAAGLTDGEQAAALRAAVSAGVLVPHEDAYEFRHALLREAAYAEVLPGERVPLHAALARRLEASPELAGADTTLAAELAYHWQAAGERERALSAAVRAGEEAERMYAHPEALRHFQRALELWEAGDGVDRVRITEAAARAANATGEHRLAVALARRAVELVDEPLRAGALHAVLGRYLSQAGRNDEAQAVAARAVSLMPDAAAPERAWALEAHARVLLLAGRIDDARAPLEEAIGIARDLELPEIEAAALATLVIAMHGQADEAVATGRAALRAARAAADPETLMRAYINAAEALDQAGACEEAIDLSRQGIEASRRIGAERVFGAHLTGDVAIRLVKLGRLDEAAALIDDALRAAPSGSAAASLHHAAATIAAHRGDAPGTEAGVANGRVHAPEAAAVLWSAGLAAAAAELRLWQGDAEGASAVVAEALAQLEGGEFGLYSAPLYALGAWAQADVALRARALGGRAGVPIDLRRRLDVQFDGTPPPEPAAYRVQLAAELGRLEDPPDADAWEDARRRWEALGFRFHVALCAWREAEALLVGGGDRSRAAELLTAAAEGAVALGARPLAAEVDALARRARIAPVAAAAPDAAPSAAVKMGLSPRELEVLVLVAEGRTNRAIASELFISEKTVSVHVSRVLSKLDAGNRAQAGAIAHRLGLV